MNAVEIAAASAARGVLGILTGADLVAAGVGGLPCGWGITGTDGLPMKEPPHPALAQGKVRYVGDAVAFILAETAHEARDAAELIEVDYTPLPAAVDLESAIAPGAPQIFEDVPGNLCCDWSIGDAAATEAAFARAHHVTKLKLVNNRLVGNPMEPRAAIAEFKPSTGQYTLWTTSQFPHVVRMPMGAFVLNIPQHRLRVVSPDVGGGFGVKQFHYAEEAIVTFAAKRFGRAVKWVCERSEGFISDAHGRDHVTEAALAMDAEGRFIGIKVITIGNIGGYISTFGPNIPTNLYAPLLAGVYTTPAIHCQMKVAFTNTVPVDAYRGASRPEATFVVERMVDIAAMEMGMDKAAIRRLNMIPHSAFPYQTPVMMKYDSGDPLGCLDRALALADWDGFPARQAVAKQQGKLRGVGLSTYIEACGLAPSRIAGQLGARGGLYESSTVRVHPTGHVTVLIGTHSHGQGHETTFAQIVAEKLGVAFEDIDIVYGDTDRVQFGMGTYGSRSLVVGGAALAKASDRVIAKGKKIAAHLLEASEVDIEFIEGRFTIAGTDRGKSFQEIALAAYVPHDYPLETVDPGLEEQAYHDPVNFSFPGGAHVAEVEIDPDTGQVTLVNYVGVDDVGTVINPMIVEGQLHGGITQGIGQALLEHCVYDKATGQILSGSFQDYCMPHADNLPSFDMQTHPVPSTDTPMGVKGCGEVGSVGAPAAIINAVVDALAPYKVRHLDMPATPARIWRAIQDHAMPMAAE